MQFRLFLRKATLFIVTLALCDFLVGSALRYFYFRIEQGPFARTTYAVNTMKKDLLIFGSSRAENHYSSEILEREWGPSFYNLGAPGQAIFYHLGILRAVLARYSPKVIILNADTYDFDASRESYDRLSSLLPYFRSHKEMRSIISLRSKFEELKLVSQIYPFNSMILTIIEGNLGPIDIDDRGYKPLTGVWKEPLAHRDFHDTTMDQEKSAAFQSFLSEASRSGARVFVVDPPIY